MHFVTVKRDQNMQSHVSLICKQGKTVLEESTQPK